MAPGRGIPELDIRGFLLTPGAGRLIVTVPGPISRAMDGFGSQEALGRDGIRFLESPTPLRIHFAQTAVGPGQTLVVNRGALATPVAGVQNRVQLRGGSAGLGVARGSVRDLGKISRQLERSSMVRGVPQTPSAASAARLPSSSRMSVSRGAPVSRSSGPRRVVDLEEVHHRLDRRRRSRKVRHTGKLLSETTWRCPGSSKILGSLVSSRQIYRYFQEVGMLSTRDWVQLGLVAASGHFRPRSSAQTISCSSDDGHRHYCPADTRGGVQLLKQRSESRLQPGLQLGF